MRTFRLLLLMVFVAVFASLITTFCITKSQDKVITCRIFRELSKYEIMSVMANCLEDEIGYNLKYYGEVNDRLLAKAKRSSEFIDWQKFKKKNIDGACECALYEYCENCIVENSDEDEFILLPLYEEAGSVKLKMSEFDINFYPVADNEVGPSGLPWVGLDLYYSFYDAEERFIATYAASELFSEGIALETSYFRESVNYKGYFQKIHNFAIENPRRYRDLIDIKGAVENLKVPEKWVDLLNKRKKAAQ